MPRRTAFTLVELLVVIAIIGILVAMLLPAVQSAARAARRMQCLNNMKQLALAMHNFQTANNELPASTSAAGWAFGTWAVTILPQIEQQNMRDAYQNYNNELNNGVHYYTAANVNAVTGRRTSIYTCPSDNKSLGWPDSPPHCANHNYAVNMGNTAQEYEGIDNYHMRQKETYNGVTYQPGPFEPEIPHSIDEVKDGSSNTLMLAEIVQGQNKDLRGLIWWGPGAGFETYLRPNDTAPDMSWHNYGWCNPNPPNPPCILYTGSGTWTFAARSRHPGGVVVSMCDGSSHFISESIELDVWRALGSARGKEVAQLP